MKQSNIIFTYFTNLNFCTSIVVYNSLAERRCDGNLLVYTAISTNNKQLSICTWNLFFSKSSLFQTTINNKKYIGLMNSKLHNCPKLAKSPVFLVINNPINRLCLNQLSATKGRFVFKIICSLVSNVCISFVWLCSLGERLVKQNWYKHCSLVSTLFYR